MHFHSLCENGIFEDNVIKGNIEDIVNDSRSSDNFKMNLQETIGTIMKVLIQMWMGMGITLIAFISMLINYGCTTPL